MQDVQNEFVVVPSVNAQVITNKPGVNEVT